MDNKILYERIQSIELFNDYETLSISELIEILQILDAEYFNANIPLIPDVLYDDIKQYVYNRAPTNAYFKKIGSAVRGGKIKLPHPMGSLNQIYIGEIIDWVVKNQLEQEIIVISDKLDGTSALLVYDKVLQIGYSRGDGIEGADISRHISKMPSIPHIWAHPANISLSVRGENIIKHNNFPKIHAATSSRSKAYTNPRNAVAGIMNSKENAEVIYNFIDFVAYDIIGDVNQTKTEMLTTLSAAGFNTPWYATVYGNELTDEMLTSLLNQRRSESPYQIDGLVLDVNCAIKRKEMNKDNRDLNPEYSTKYKVADSDNIAEATCVLVDWNASKHSYLKPRIEIEPIQLCGVTVTYVQGFNAKFIKDNNIGPGTTFMITRAGDVIPHIVGGAKNPKIIHSTIAQMPNEDYTWNETGVDAILVSTQNREDVIVNQLIDFFTKIKVPGLKAGNITALVTAGYTTPEDIIKLDLVTLQNILNSEIIGEKIFDGIKKCLINVPFETLMGAYSTSRGIGIRKIKPIYKQLGLRILEITHQSQLLNIEGIQEKTADKIILEIQLFNEFIKKIDGYFNFAEMPIATDKNTGIFANQQIVITGFRDNELEQYIETNGGVMQSGVNKKTTLVIAADPSENSGKIKKAKTLNIAITSLNAFKIKYGID